MTKHRIGMLAIASAFAITVLAASPSVRATTTDDWLLPDLVMLQPTEFHLEKKPKGGRWLRFSTIIANIGPGVFDVYGYEPNGTTITSSSRLAVTQRFQDSAGAFTEFKREPAEMFYAGDGHAHWHVLNLQSWTLAFEATPNDALATGAKRGFCFWDNVDLHTQFSNYDGRDECHLDAATGTVPMGSPSAGATSTPGTSAISTSISRAFPTATIA